MELLQQVNATAQKLISEQEQISANFQFVSEMIDKNEKPLTEAVTDWLAALRNKLSKDSLTPDQKQNVAYALGAIAALTNPENDQAFDEINALRKKGIGLGTFLYNIRNKNDKSAREYAMNMLQKIGRDPSAKSYVDNALQKLDDPNEINKLITQLQTKIDQVMRVNLAKEKGGTTSATGGAGVGGSPERSA